MFKFNLVFNISTIFLKSELTSLDKKNSKFFLVLNQKLMSWSFKTHGIGNRTSGGSFRWRLIRNLEKGCKRIMK